MRFSTTISAILFSASLATSQAVPDDTINFSTLVGFKDLRRCLKAVFVLDYAINAGTVQKELGCETNDCLCRPDILQQAVTRAGSMALSDCSNSNDKLSATAVLTSYCSDKGYTEAFATATDDTGAGAAVTIFATTTVAMITATETVTGSSAPSSLVFGLQERLLGFGLVTLAMVFLA